ncbi:MAG: hypothetical protein J2P16_01170 [Mycobacterium sp.]|nr:hypothetical protein [Mycobacterium sp.]
MLDFPNNPQLNDVFQNWRWDGTRWVTIPIGTFPDAQPGLVPALPPGSLPTDLLSASGWDRLTLRVLRWIAAGTYTYVPSPGMVAAQVKMRGGGGAGGQVPSRGATVILAASGGGQGAYAEFWVTPTQVGASATAVVGAGGNSAVSPVTHGGATSFTALGSFGTYSVNGGNTAASTPTSPNASRPIGVAGQGGPANALAAPSNAVVLSGAPGSDGIVLQPASVGTTTPDILVRGGHGGGMSGFNTSASGLTVAVGESIAGFRADATAGGMGPGAGGQGGATNQDSTGTGVVTGGNGAAGMVIIYEWSIETAAQAAAPSLSSPNADAPPDTGA